MIKMIYRLVKLEYTKFKKNSVIGLLALMYMVSLPTIIFLGKEIDELPEPFPDNSIFFKFPMMWEFLGFIGNWLSLFMLGLIAVFLVVTEVGFKTFRQNIITGLTRKEFYMAKIFSIICISAMAAIYYMIIGLAIGIIHTDGWTISEAFDNSGAIPRYFLLTLGYMSLGLLFGFVVRRSGIAVLTYLIYLIIIEHILKWALHFRYFKNETINYYPGNAFEDLMPLPFFRFADLIPKKGLNFEFLLPYPQATLISIIYIVVFLYLGWLSFNKKDI